MRTEVVEKLLTEYPTLKHLSSFKPVEKEVNKGDWFLLETNPFPSNKEVAKMIASDLINDGFVRVNQNGTLEHNSNCVGTHELEAEVIDAIDKIKSRNFRIAIWENPTDMLNHQPTAIALDPVISLYSLPDHPHINSGAKYFPDTLCYTDKPEELGKDPLQRISMTIDILNTWLFSHLIWLETRKAGKGIWIGPAVDTKSSVEFGFLRNPDGICRCGSKKRYSKCHLNQDFYAYYNLVPPFTAKSIESIPYLNKDMKFNVDEYRKKWKESDTARKNFTAKIIKQL